MLIPFGILSAAGGGEPVFADAYEHIATASPDGVREISFTSIPTDYKHLQIRFSVQCSSTASQLNLRFQLNNDDTTILRSHRLEGVGGSVSSTTRSSDTFLQLNNVVPNINNDAARYFSSGIVDILDYQNTNKNTTLKAIYGNQQNELVGIASGTWLSTNAVNRISVFMSATNLVNRTRIALYGIKG